MLSNCHHLGLDPETATLSDYLETLEAHNAAHDPKGGDKSTKPSGNLSKFLKAHNDA